MRVSLDKTPVRLGLHHRDRYRGAEQTVSRRQTLAEELLAVPPANGPDKETSDPLTVQVVELPAGSIDPKERHLVRLAHRLVANPALHRVDPVLSRRPENPRLVVVHEGVDEVPVVTD